MTNAQAVRVVEVARRKADELFAELIAELGAPEPEHSEDGDPTASESKDPSVWSLPDAPMKGGFEEVGRSSGESYRWGDGNVDHYPDFVRFRGTGDYAGMNLGLGYKDNGEVVGFLLGAGGGLNRGITYFFLADDFATSDEKVSMIRGAGPRGRSGFGPTDAEPPAYAGFQLDTLAARVGGKFNRLAVVASADDEETMLSHTAIQAKLRDLA